MRYLVKKLVNLNFKCQKCPNFQMKINNFFGNVRLMSAVAKPGDFSSINKIKRQSFSNHERVYFGSWRCSAGAPT